MSDLVSIDGGKQLNGNSALINWSCFRNTLSAVSIDGGKQLNGNVHRVMIVVGYPHQCLGLHWWGQTIEWKHLVSDRSIQSLFRLHWWGQTIEWKPNSERFSCTSNTLRLHWWGQTIEWKHLCRDGWGDGYSYLLGVSIDGGKQLNGNPLSSWLAWVLMLQLVSIDGGKQLNGNWNRSTSNNSRYIKSPLMGANNWMETSIGSAANAFVMRVSIDGGKQLNGNSAYKRYHP